MVYSSSAAIAVPFRGVGLCLSKATPPPDWGGPSEMLRLDKNESPFGPSEKVRSALMGALATVNRFPDRECEQLIDRIASHHEVGPEQVVIGCGSTEIFRSAVAALLHRGGQLLQATPTFGAIESYARSAEGEVVSIPLTSRFAHDLDAMLTSAGRKPSLIYICNPNNPTATLTPRNDLETFIKALPTDCRVIIDEAYHDYVSPSARYASFIDRPIHDERVLVTRTFSKIFGLAGLRLGYAIGASDLIKSVGRYLTRENVNSVMCRAAIVALEDSEFVPQVAKKNVDDRQEFMNQATARMLKPIDSHTNFVMMNAHSPAEGVIKHFRDHGILIGPRFPSMETHVRVSLGLRDEMLRFWAAWDLGKYGEMQM